MLKNLTLQQLENTKTNFFKNLKNLFEKKRYTSLKDFITELNKTSNEIYFLEWNEIIFKIEIKDKNFTFIDLKEKISLTTDQEQFKILNNKLKNPKKIDNKNKKTIVDILFEKYKSWQLNKIIDKPFLIYDIETIGNINDLKQVKFMMWYTNISSEDHSNNIKYRYIWEKSLKKFVDFVLDFDGYIIWYNNISFDNPVIIYNVGYWQKELEILNKKSLDIFLFIWWLTGRRLWLNDVANALVNIKKTLSSWLEWEKYLKEYLKTKDSTLLNKVKNYCKNDVKMTLGVLLYLLDNNILHIDWKNFQYTIQDMIKLWSTNNESQKENKKEKTLF